ncbi:MAG: ABC transporter ATP-binding protein [Rubellimicrobium sp.]|nr:ABC transporter ATP-binding protein [Rubellimicrobium sp.]
MRSGTIHALAGVSLDIRRGRTLALVGESGSGKTTLGNQILGTDTPTSGRILFEGRDMPARRDTQMRRRIQVVQQSPYTTLNPKRTVRQILDLPLSIHDGGPRRQRRERIAELLEIVGIPSDFMERHPHSLSGGQRQRVALARALASKPDVIVLDEPTSSLDVSVQARILRLLVDLQARYGLTYLFITHDLSVVRNIADEVAVLYRGHVVEHGTTPELFRAPRHRYTTMLLSSIPVLSEEEEALKPAWDWDVTATAAEPPSTGTCPFLPRCPHAVASCSLGVPPRVATSPTNWHACCNPRPEGADADAR